MNPPLLSSIRLVPPMRIRSKFIQHFLDNPNTQVPFIDFRVDYRGNLSSANPNLKPQITELPIPPSLMYQYTDKSIPLKDYVEAWKELRLKASLKTKDKESFDSLYLSYIEANAHKFLNAADFNRHFVCVFGTRVPDHFRNLTSNLTKIDGKSRRVISPKVTPVVNDEPVEPIVNDEPVILTPYRVESISPPPQVTTETPKLDSSVSIGGLTFKVSDPRAKICIGEIECNDLSASGGVLLSVGKVGNGKLFDVIIAGA